MLRRLLGLIEVSERLTASGFSSTYEERKPEVRSKVLVLRAKEWEVSQRLRELGLDLEGMQSVSRAGYRARVGCSPLHPPTFPGTSAWAACVHGLRSQYIPAGWRFADPGNFSMTINDALKIYIVCATGDEASGKLIGRTPTTKTPKGQRTEIAVKRQGELWPEAVPEDAAVAEGVGGYTAFWFLLNIEGRRIFSELSSPSEIQRGKITSWSERNILPVIDLDDSPIVGTRGPRDGFTGEFDIPVQRIA